MHLMIRVSLLSADNVALPSLRADTRVEASNSLASAPPFRCHSPTLLALHGTFSGPSASELPRMQHGSFLGDVDSQPHANHRAQSAPTYRRPISQPTD